MVFGNTGTNSGTGVAFTRDPNNGEDEFFGDYLINAQGEDVVAGIRTPEPITPASRTRCPRSIEQLMDIRKKLESHYKEMQDIEFTVAGWDSLHAPDPNRQADRIGRGADRRRDGQGGADRRNDRDQARQPGQLESSAPAPARSQGQGAVVARGIAASPGAACGKVILSAEAAVEHHEKHPDDPILLVRKETSPEDVAGMHLAKGILTATGGKASHAAVVARGWGKPCVVGCDAIAIDEMKGEVNINGKVVKVGDFITINGTTGDVMIGKVPTVDPTISGHFATLMSWADKVRTLKVRTNADTPEDAGKARSFGAEGIGLCRTEHMFFEGQRIVDMRKMILADDEAGRKTALAELEPYQKQDFIGIFEAMDGLPVTIRLLDPPLHEFLPHDERPARPRSPASSASRSRRSSAGSNSSTRPTRCSACAAAGCRSSSPRSATCRSGRSLEAAIEVKKKGKTVLPEIMIPLIGTVEELTFLKKRALAVAEEVFKQGRRRRSSS